MLKMYHFRVSNPKSHEFSQHTVFFATTFEAIQYMAEVAADGLEIQPLAVTFISSITDYEDWLYDGVEEELGYV